MLETLVDFDKQLLLHINSWNSPFLDQFFFAATSLNVWIPIFLVLLYFVWRRQQSWKSFCFFIVIIALTILFADQIASGIIKPLVGRFRPTHDPEIGSLIHTVNNYRGGRFGFVSSHAANSLGITLVIWLLFKNNFVGGVLLAWTLVFSYSRMYLGVHYPFDILGGYVVAAISIGLVFVIYHFITKKYTSLKFVPLKRQDGFYVLAIFLLNLLSLFTYAWLVD